MAFSLFLCFLRSFIVVCADVTLNALVAFVTQTSFMEKEESATVQQFRVCVFLFSLKVFEIIHLIVPHSVNVVFCQVQSGGDSTM